MSIFPSNKHVITQWKVLQKKINAIPLLKIIHSVMKIHKSLP